ncbi:MAG: AMIN domain-containing protein, partial [Gammaproteobacteria bacterium]|nr:AMIN domain-containing protein [Gammaproteobacteria bacterium]
MSVTKSPKQHATLDGLTMCIKRFVFLLAALLTTGVVSAQQQDVQLESIGFANLTGDTVEIRLGFDGSPPQPDGFVLDNPARISIDLNGVASGLSQQRYEIDSTNADSVIVLDDGSRTRLIVNLSRVVNYESNIVGNNIVLTVGNDATESVSPAVAGTIQQQNAPSSSATSSGGLTINDVSFRRGAGDEGQVVIELSSDRIVGSIEQIGARVFVEFSNTTVPERLNRRFDVTDFATPVATVDVLGDDGNATVIVDVDGNYEYVAYQTGTQYTISVQPPPVTAVTEEDPTDAYNGEISSLSFQDVEIHAALQILADEYDFNLVAPAIDGTVTLQLQNVPWDQALDLVLRAGNLDKRLVGNVLYVAPAEEIAAQEQAELQANLAAQALAPLYTEFVQINYASANDILTLLLGTGTEGQGGLAQAEPVEGAGPTILEAGGNGILSSRGSATVDPRTNIIIVRDVEEKLEEVRNMVAQLDVPVRQVLIEARIVNVTTDYGRDLGVRWGGAGSTAAHDNFRYGGSLDSTIEQNNNRVARELAMQEAVLAGEGARLDALEQGSDPSLIPALIQQAINSIPI